MGKKLVHIYTSPDNMTAELAKGFLKENGIKALIKPNPGPHGAFLGQFGGAPPFDPWLVYVWEDRAEEAKRLVAGLNKESSESSSRNQGAKPSRRLGWLELIVGIVALTIVIVATFINLGLGFALAILISIVIRVVLRRREQGK